MIRINGIPCHEAGCPDEWKYYSIKCKECGQEFIPEEQFQICCSQDCTEMYYGY